MLTFVVIAALGLAIATLWVVRGRQIKRMRSEIRDLRSYIVSLDEASRLAHIAPGGESASTPELPRRRRRHLSIVPAALIGAGVGVARRVWTDPVILGSAATVALAFSAVGLAVWTQDDARPPSHSQAWEPPPVPQHTAPDPPIASEPPPTSAPDPGGRERSPRGEIAARGDEEPPPPEEPEPRPAPAELPPEDPEAEVAPEEVEPEPEPSPVDELVEAVIGDVRVNLEGSAPEPPTLLGKAEVTVEAVRLRVSEIATEPGHYQANTA